MAGIVQPKGAKVPVADTPKAHPPPMVPVEQLRTQPQEGKSQSQVVSDTESGVQSLMNVPSTPLHTGRGSELTDPPPAMESRQEPSMGPVEPPRERERNPPKNFPGETNFS